MHINFKIFEEKLWELEKCIERQTDRKTEIINTVQFYWDVLKSETTENLHIFFSRLKDKKCHNLCW